MSFIAAEMFPGANQALTNLLFGMVLRIGVPLAACVLVYARAGSLASGGFAFFVLGFYFVALPTDTALLVSKLGRKGAAA